MLTLQAARFLGINILSVTRSEAERDRARDSETTWAGGYDEPVPGVLDGAITFSRWGASSLRRFAPLGLVEPWPLDAIHLDGIPAFDYDLLWRERGLRSVANYRARMRERSSTLRLASRSRRGSSPSSLSDANGALMRVRSGDVSGTPRSSCLAEPPIRAVRTTEAVRSALSPNRRVAFHGERKVAQ